MLKSRIFPILLSLFVLPALACGVTIPESPVQLQEPPAQVVITQVVTPEAVIAAPAVNAPTAPIQAYELTTSEEAVLVELYRRVNPSVVNLTVYSVSSSQNLVPSSEGSGFVYDNAGHIVTNAHVVHGAERIEVTFSDGRTRPAELVGEDFNSDLAVVRVVELPEGIGALPLGSMEDLLVGQTVVAIGNPFGQEGTLTRGIISALGRTIPALNVFSIPQSIQTDAAINPGNSGGPLLNLRGEVIGVNAQIRTDGDIRANSGVGFAIPVSILNRVVPALIEDGQYTWSWLGISGGSVSYSLAQANNLPDDRGAYIAEVVRNGPAAKAGLRGATGSVVQDGIQVPVGGDVVIAIDGQPVNTFDDLLVYVALETDPGQEVILTILRAGKTMEVPLELEPRPSNFTQDQ
jgi:2-alkenal reductase